MNGVMHFLAKLDRLWSSIERYLLRILFITSLLHVAALQLFRITLHLSNPYIQPLIDSTTSPRLIIIFTFFNSNQLAFLIFYSLLLFTSCFQILSFFLLIPFSYFLPTRGCAHLFASSFKLSSHWINYFIHLFSRFLPLFLWGCSRKSSFRLFISS
jgi:hypothetical protein